MTGKTKETARASSPASQLAGWARQGIESFSAAQKILLDLTAQQNALVIGMLRERLTMPKFNPAHMVTKVADKSVKGLTNSAKILLDFAEGETELMVHGVKEGLPLPKVAGTLAEVARHRVDTFIGLQKHLLDATAEHAHEVTESFREGKGLAAVASVTDLARKGIESFVETEKKFLDLAAHEVTAATKGGAEGHKSPRERAKVLTKLAREGVEKYIDTQKKLLNLAIDQLESDGEPATRKAEPVRKEPRTPLSELTQKSVHNLVTAQKSLMDLAMKPIKAKTAETNHKTPRNRGKRVKMMVHEPPVRTAGAPR